MPPKISFHVFKRVQCQPHVDSVSTVWWFGENGSKMFLFVFACAHGLVYRLVPNSACQHCKNITIFFVLLHFGLAPPSTITQFRFEPSTAYEF
jgi:hypothetical protein